jgi:hypothetical protein
MINWTKAAQGVAVIVVAIFATGGTSACPRVLYSPELAPISLAKDCPEEDSNLDRLHA